MMAKIQMGPRRLLILIRAGIANGNLDAAIQIIDDALAQLPPDEEQSAKNPEPAITEAGDGTSRYAGR